MKVVGNVSPDDVPQPSQAAKGMWTGLAMQAIEAHERGEVLVVSCTDRQEYKRMTNGMSEKIRNAGYARRFTVVDEPDGSVRAYLQLLDQSVRKLVVSPAKRRERRRAAKP